MIHITDTTIQGRFCKEARSLCVLLAAGGRRHTYLNQVMPVADELSHVTFEGFEDLLTEPVVGYISNADLILTRYDKPFIVAGNTLDEVYAILESRNINYDIEGRSFDSLEAES